MIHSSYFRPKAIPYNGDTAMVDIDRLQDLSASTSLNREKIKEIGRDGLVAWRAAVPETSPSLTQLEYGTLDFWNTLANKAANNIYCNLTDFKTSKIDIVGLKTDDSGTFLGTVWYPKCRVSGFGVSFGDPQALIERSFSLVGDNEILLLNDNKYLIFFKDDTCSGASHTLTIGDSGSGLEDYPDPVMDPDNSGEYILRVVRVRGTANTELTYVASIAGTTDSYTYNSGTNTITFGSDSANNDVYKVWYSATTDTNGVMTWTSNDTDASGLETKNCSIYLNTSNYVYRLQSVSVDVSLARNDYREIGNKDVVLYGASDVNATVTLGRILETYTIEEILRGKGGSSYGKIDAEKYEDNISLTIKIYNNSDKDTFLIGYKFVDLAPTALDKSVPTSDYINRGATLGCEEGIITNVEATLDAYTGA